MSLVGETKMKILRELKDGPAHGYAIAEELEVSSGGIYVHLDELKGEGMVEVVEDEQEGRQRTVYQLTENGELLLKALGE
jgi:DNA-binding PadR family transcriptional regulator